MCNTEDDHLEVDPSIESSELCMCSKRWRFVPSELRTFAERTRLAVISATSSVFGRPFLSTIPIVHHRGGTSVIRLEPSRQGESHCISILDAPGLRWEAGIKPLAPVHFNTTGRASSAANIQQAILKAHGLTVCSPVQQSSPRQELYSQP